MNHRPLLIFLATLLLASFARAAEISGVVVDEQGNPIAGATLDVWTWYPGNETKTDKDGKFTLKNLSDDGPVELKVSKQGYSPYYNENEPTGVTDARYTLTNKTFFEGTVLSPDGKPVPNAAIKGTVGEKINKRIHITSVSLQTRSDKDGHYKFYCWPDTYELQVLVPKVGALRTPGNQVGEGEGKSLDLQLEAPISLKVIAHDAQTNTPIEGVHFSGTRGAGGAATTAKDGTAEIPDLLPGKINLNVQCKGYARWWVHDQRPDDYVYFTHFIRNVDNIEVDVSRGMDPITVDLEKVVTISGIVQDPDGNPVPRATIAPVTSGSGDTITSDTRYNVISKKDGSFTMNLPASLDQQYVLVAHDGSRQKPGKWAAGRTDDLKTEPGQEIKDTVIKLTRGGTVKGKLLTANGDPAPHRGVRYMPADWDDTRYLVTDTTTDNDGNFELKNVPPGDQLIQCNPWFMDPKDYQSDQSVQVTVESNQTVEGVEVKLRQGD